MADKEPETIAIVSNCISQITWDPNDNSTTIEFVHGEVLHWNSIPRKVFDELASAPSAGQYFNRNIRGRYT